MSEIKTYSFKSILNKNLKFKFLVTFYSSFLVNLAFTTQIRKIAFGECWLKF